MAAILKWPKTGSPSDFYLMASTFDIGGGLVSKKNLVSDFHRWRVHMAVAHGLTQKMTGNAQKIRLNGCL